MHTNEQEFGSNDGRNRNQRITRCGFPDLKYLRDLRGLREAKEDCFGEGAAATDAKQRPGFQTNTPRRPLPNQLRPCNLWFKPISRRLTKSSQWAREIRREALRVSLLVRANQTFCNIRIDSWLHL